MYQVTLSEGLPAMLANTKEEYLTVHEAAELLDLHSNTIYKLIQTGELPAIRIKKRIIRIAKSDLERYLAKQKTS